MSTSLLYHGFRVRDYRYLATKYEGGGIIFVIERKPDTYCCSACGSTSVWREAVVVRPFRAVPLGRERVTLEARIPRLACQDCGAVRQAAIGFAEPVQMDGLRLQINEILIAVGPRNDEQPGWPPRNTHPARAARSTHPPLRPEPRGES